MSTGKKDEEQHVYGPDGLAIKGHIARCRRLSRRDIEDLIATRVEPSPETLAEIRTIADTAGLGEAVLDAAQQAREAVAGAAIIAAAPEAIPLDVTPQLVDTAAPAAEAAAESAMGLVLCDVIPLELYAQLTRSWRGALYAFLSRGQLG
jgi:hypothetical protein